MAGLLVSRLNSGMIEGMFYDVDVSVGSQRVLCELCSCDTGPIFYSVIRRHHAGQYDTVCCCFGKREVDGVTMMCCCV